MHYEKFAIVHKWSQYYGVFREILVWFGYSVETQNTNNKQG